MWLGSGIFLLGAGAALAGGAGVAHADTSSAGTSATSHHQRLTEARHSAAATPRKHLLDQRSTTRGGLSRRGGDVDQSSSDTTSTHRTKNRTEHKSRPLVAASAEPNPSDDEISQRIAAQSAAFAEQHTAIGSQQKTFATDVKEALLDFSTTPPEINSIRIHAGAGAEALLSASAAWNNLATGLNSTARGLDHVADHMKTTTPLGSALSSTVESYAGWLSAAAAHAESASTQASATAVAFESAFSAGVPPSVVAANRATLAALVTVNLFTPNVPAIAATELMYLDLWSGRFSTQQTPSVR